MSATCATNTVGLLTAPPAGRPPSVDLTQLIELAEAAGLTGRGGAGFPTAIKLRAVAAARRPVVVANAMEGEPLSHKDEYLLTRAPHLVVEGLAAVAAALDASRAIVAAGPGMPVAAVTAAAAVRHGVEVRTVQGGFVAGQESALTRGLSGLPAVPADPSVRVTERGVDGRPTLVINAETAAALTIAIRFGPEAARTRLFTLSGAFDLPGVVEAPLSARLGDVLDRGDLRPLAAVLVGGYHGTRLPASAVTTPISELDLGAGVLHALDATACPLAATADIATYLAAESARQCGPCLNALPRLADTLQRLARRKRDPLLPAQVERLAALATGRGACAHPDGTVRMVLSAINLFTDDVTAHLEGRCLS